MGSTGSKTIKYALLFDSKLICNHFPFVDLFSNVERAWQKAGFVSMKNKFRPPQRVIKLIWGSWQSRPMRDNTAHKKLKSLLSCVISYWVWTSGLSGFLLCHVYVGHHLHFNLSQREIKLVAVKFLLWYLTLCNQASSTFHHVTWSTFYSLLSCVSLSNRVVGLCVESLKPVPTSVGDQSLIEPELSPAIAYHHFR